MKHNLKTFPGNGTRWDMIHWKIGLTAEMRAMLNDGRAMISIEEILGEKEALK